MLGVGNFDDVRLLMADDLHGAEGHAEAEDSLGQQPNAQQDHRSLGPRKGMEDQQQPQNPGENGAGGDEPPFPYAEA